MQSDQRLIRKVKKKNWHAADLLIERYYKEIYAYVFRQTGERELAMDLTQEIFILVLQKIDLYDEAKSGFRTWLYRIASNKVTDYYRSASHKRKMLEQPLIRESDENENQIENLLEHQNQFEWSSNMTELNIEELIIRKELISQIMLIVTEYPVEWAKIFQKKCFEEMTFQEVAENLNLSVNTVKTRFYKMVRRIRQEVDYDG